MDRRKIWIDGACSPNPGKMGCGVYMPVDGGDHVSISAEGGQGTNNESEWRALLLALTLCVEMGITKARIHSDSALVVNQYNERWRKRAAMAIRMFAACQELVRKNNLDIKLVWIPREQNGYADALAKSATAK